MKKAKSEVRMRVKVSSIIGLFCLIGCLYQIHGMTKFYLKFKVRHDVAYDYSTSIELPAIDIMVPMGMAINWTKLIADSKEMQEHCEAWRVKYGGRNNTNSNKNCGEYITSAFQHQIPFLTSLWLNQIKVSDIEMLAIDLREQVLQLLFSSFGYLTGRHCKLTRFYNGLGILLRIFCLNGTKLFSVDTDFVEANEGVVALLNHSLRIDFGIRFSDPADLPNYDPSKYFMVTGKPGSFPHVTISFVKTVMSSLEYPYETNCRHYNKDKTISKCMTEYTLSQSTPYLDRFVLYEWNEQPSYLGFIDAHSENGRISMGEVYAFINCNQQAAANECEKTNYLTQGKSSDEHKGKYSLIVIEPSWRVNIHLSVHPVLTWSEYVIFIGSIAGFWFGVSMYDLIFEISNGIKIRCLNFKCKLRE